MTTTDALAATSTVLALIALLVSILVARAQLVLGRRDQLFSLLGEVLSIYHSPDFRATRDYIKGEFISDFPPDSQGKVSFSEEARKRVQVVTTFFFRVGFLVHEQVISIELVSAYMGRSVLDCWTILRPYIEAERTRRHDPNYYGYFEHLASEVREYGQDRLSQHLKLSRWND